SLKAGMIAELVPHVAVHADVMEKVVALKDPVLLHHPMVLLGNERLQDRGSYVRMVKRAEGVADIMQQCTGDVFVVASVLHGEARSQKRVPQPIDGKTTEVAVEQFEVRDNSRRQEVGIAQEITTDDRPIFSSRVLDAGKGRDSIAGHRLSLHDSIMPVWVFRLPHLEPNSPKQACHNTLAPALS